MATYKRPNIKILYVLSPFNIFNESDIVIGFLAVAFYIVFIVLHIFPAFSGRLQAWRSM